ncbi:MAG TPA: diaminopimelate decarboxylase [Phycisphaerae bacterium]|nr:diaminopimelate decarboxylase [Phycisphaerae bacterium]
MDCFGYRGGVLHCEEVPLPEVADRFGTPAYVYSRRTLLGHYDRLAEAFGRLRPSVCFSVKSCQNLHILRLLGERGAWFDVVSGGELRRVLEAGGDPGKVVFAGVGKTDDEIRGALEAGIAWFNVESEQELETFIELAGRLGKPARAALRVNPDVDPKTHVYTTTGKKETKFGVDIERARAAFGRYGGGEYVELSGIHLHLGSPVNRIEPYVRSISKALALIEELRQDGHDIRAINIGGGFGAHYEGSEAPSAADYAGQIVPLLADRGLGVLLEPGRSIAANAGVLLARTLYVKQSGDRQFVIVDAAMTELLRPALYGAYHFAWPVVPGDGLVPPHRGPELKLPGTRCVDVVGGVCESADFLAKDRWLPPVRRGDLIALFAAGAYGFTMASQYNSRPRACEVLVDGGAVKLIRRRETYEDLVDAERL